ncbi:D-alanyl-D-alanine carboxypeptidase family protein [Enterococcus sp. LJL128]|uniref:D-alanyl-D-alanine carboxypeptidase family protein n=1 Tax=Enterococcus sp. LJL51 TaxID=3416656 RepID=UPI003CF5E86C
MKNRNRRYLQLSVLAIALLLVSFFYYENNRKKVEQSVNTAYSLSVDSEERSSETKASQTKDTTASTEVAESSEEVLSPQTIKEPKIVKGIVVVNKRYPLPESYDPGENSEALAAFKKMNEEMRNLGLNISEEYSGYRSYKEQEELYKNYVEGDGQETAERYSSRPGYSEHQTGLAFDFIDTAGELANTETEAAWIRDNAHRYGFIVRYKEGQESITGYMAEAWHVRYVGEEAAEEIHEKNLTLEEYLDVQGGDYEEEQ